MSRGNGLVGFGRAQGVVRPGLAHVAAGYIDEEIVTVRKMAKAGATADEIGAACGKTAAWAYKYIRRNGIVWNNKIVGGTPDRHMVLSARSIAMHIDAGHGQWTDEGLKMFKAGAPIRTIAARFGISPDTCYEWFRRHGHQRPRIKRTTGDAA